jgi:AcrR family transcriptional regulator
VPARRPSAAPREILEAAEAVLLEDGVGGVSIRKVSDRCGYSAPTIYHHFSDKQGLIDHLLEARFRRGYEVMAAIPPSDDPAAHLRAMAEAFVAFARRHPRHYQLLFQAGLRDVESVPSATAARELVRRDLERLAATGRLASDDREAAFEVLWAVVHGVISLYLGTAGEELAPNLLELTLDVVVAGLLRRGDAR